MPTEFSMTRRVHFVEVDFAGVLHFSNYYRVMDEVECEFWRSLGMGLLTGDGSRRLNWPRVSTSCEHYAPVRFEDELEVRLRITHVGEKSLRYEVDFHRDGRQMAHGKMTVVCCSSSVTDGSFEPIPIPGPIRAKLAAMLPGAA